MHYFKILKLYLLLAYNFKTNNYKQVIFKFFFNVYVITYNIMKPYHYRNIIVKITNKSTLKIKIKILMFLLF